MSGVDDRVVSMQFNNESFERKLGETIQSLDKLRTSLDFSHSTASMTGLTTAANGVHLGNIGSEIERIASRFTILGEIGHAAIEHITGTVLSAAGRLAKVVFDPLLAGGKQRALNIEQAKFAFKGLGIDVQGAMDSALAAVKGTSYGLDEAAKAAAAFGASGVAVGPPMTQALRGIAGTAAITGSTFSDIAQIFTGIAGTNKVGNMQLQEFAFRGLNAAAIIGKQLHKTEAQVHDMATAGTLDFKTFSKAMDDSLGKHSTEANQTFSGSLANVHAALSRVGAAFFTPLLAKQRDVFNSITPVIDKVAVALKPLISAFTDITNIKGDKVVKFFDGINFTGFTKALTLISQGIRNIFTAIDAVIAPIKLAFRDIFPPQTGSILVTLSGLFLELTKHLIVGAETAHKIRRAFDGLFAVLSIGWEIIKGIAGVIGEVLKAIFPVGGGILDFAAGTGDTLVKLQKALVAGGGIRDFFTNIGKVIQEPIKFIKKFVDAIGEFFGAFSVSTTAEGGLTRVGSRIQSVSDIADKASTSFDRFHIIVDAIKKVLGEIGHFIGQFFSGLGNAIVNSIKPGDFNPAIDALNVGLLGGITLMIQRFISGGGKLDLTGGIFTKIGKSFDALTNQLKSMQQQVKAKTLLEIAAAVAILVVSVIALSLVDSAALTRAMVALAVGFGELVGVMAIMDQMSGSTMDAVKMTALAASLSLIAGAMILFAIAVTIMSRLSWTELAKGLGGIAVGLGLLILATRLISTDASGLIATGLALGVMAAALLVLSYAVKAFGSMKWGEMAHGLIGIAGALIVVGEAMRLMPNNMVITSGALVVTAAALLVLSYAVKAFGSMKWSEMAKGLIGIGGGLIIIGYAMGLMPLTLPLTAPALLILAAALIVMAEAVEKMGKLNLGTLAKGLGGMAVMLGILVIALNLMNGTLLGSASLVIAAGALYIMAEVLEKLGKLKISEILTGLAAMAGVLLVLGGAAFLLQPLIPAMLGLGIAMTLVGVGFILFGAGLSLISIGITALAATGLAGINILIAVFKRFVAFLPEVVGALALSIVQLAEHLLQAAPLLIKLVVAIIGQLLDAIIVLVPKVAKAISVIIPAALKLLRDHFPDVLETGLLILETLLKGIRDHIDKVVSLAIDIIIKIVDTLVKNAVKIVGAAVLLVATFVGELANQAGKIVTAAVDIVIALVKGIDDNAIKLVNAAGDLIAKFIVAIIGKIGDIVDAGAKALAKFIEGVGNDAGTIAKAAVDMLTKFISGLATNVLTFAGSTADLLVNFLNGLAITIRTKSKEINDAGVNIIQAILDGITVGLTSGAPAVLEAIGKFALSLPGKFLSSLIARSPSRVFIEAAKTIPQGIAYALDNDTTAKASVVRHAEKIVTAFQATLDKIPPSLAGLEEFHPVITPVLDLTKVHEASKGLDQLLSVSSLTPNVSHDRAQVISNTEKTVSSAAAGQASSGGGDVKFEQNIYAPVALSTNDIYRQTNSQIALAKEELAIP